VAAMSFRAASPEELADDFFDRGTFLHVE